MAFREVHGQGRIEFQKALSGRMELVTAYPFFVFEKPTVLRDRVILLPVAIGSLCVLVLTLLFWPIGAIVRRHYGRKLELPDGERRMRRWTRFIVVLDLLLVATYATIVLGGLSNIDLFGPKLDPWLRVMQGLALLSLVGAVVALWDGLRAWASRSRGVWSKLGETLIMLACLGIAWLVLAGGLLHVGKTY